MKTHGKSETREYRAWCHMLGRCYCEGDSKYADYGGRGIQVCLRWKTSFVNFYDAMGKCPDDYSLGRKDNDANYVLKNCRWETPLQQAQNKRNNVYVTVSGKRIVIAEAERVLGIHRGSITQRVKNFAVTHQQAADHFWARKLSGKRVL